MASKRDMSSSTHSDPSENAAELRRKLSSVAWVQCDNTECLKWRKVRLEVAQQLTDSTPWTCNQNEDPEFNRCSVPEEDTGLYDRLAKRVKLDIIKSELKPGTLVWAKIDGYCKWPALITADPLNGEHQDGDEFEILWYHVEFVGGERSHSWVRSKFVEVFGPGNTDLVVKNSKNTPGKRKTRRKSKGSNAYRRTGKNTYKGGHAVQKAIAEALQLLPSACEERLQTCRFVCDWKDSDHHTSSKDLEPVKMSGSKGRKVQQSKQETQTAGRVGGKTNEGLRRTEKFTKNMYDRNVALAEVYSKNNDTETSLTKRKALPEFKEQNKKYKAQHNCVRNRNGKNLTENSTKLECLDFPSSLLDTSKEERFMLDVEMYQRKEKAFEDDVTRFMVHNELKLSSAPVWQNIRVSIFSLYLAVHERGGFVKVSESRQWSAVYTEVANQENKQGGSLAKKFYKRNLYPYEMYVNGQDFHSVIKELKQPSKSKRNRKPSVSGAGDSGVYSDDLQTFCHEDDEFDSPDVVKHLDELDQILKSLEKEQAAEYQDRLVPVHGADIRLDCTTSKPLPSPKFRVATGSELGLPTEPEEKAQVVPDLDFPSSIESNQNNGHSSQHSGDEQVLHEMQALQYDMDCLEDQINLL